MSYHMPDLTGTDPLHRVVNEVHAIREDQKIYFTTPVFAESISLELVGTAPSKTFKQVFLRDKDWVVNDDDIDKAAMSRVCVMDETFDKVLVRSVTMIAPYVGKPYKVNTAYQQLYPNTIRTASYMTEPLDFTPALLQDMLTEIDNLRLQVSRVHDVTSPESAYTRLMEEDMYMTDPLNIVENEVHTLDTPNNVCYIKPMYGSFYKDTLKVYHPTRKEYLKEGTDYRIVGMNVAKTKATKSTSSVFDYVMIVTEMVGEVEISYHAYGGEAALVNFHDVWNRVLAMISYLNEARFITESTIGRTAAWNCHENRLGKLEELMRRLLAGTPSYGDVTHGKSRVYKVTSADSDLHWWTLGTLFKVDGSDSIINADRMKLRINLMHAKCIMDVYTSMNLNNPKDNRFTVDVVSDNYPRGYVPFKDYSGVDVIIRPQFRVIWNEDPVRQSGFILQIGMQLRNIHTETIGIEDMSGAECCWVLRDEQETAITPEDDFLALPAEKEDMNKYFIWSTNNPRSLVESTLLPFKHGHLIWAGVQCLNRPGGWQHFRIPHFLEPEVDYRRITKVRLELAERSSYQFPLDIEVVPGLDTMVGTTSTSYYKEPLDVMIQMERDPLTQDILISLNTNVCEDGANPLDLMGVVVYM